MLCWLLATVSCAVSFPLSVALLALCLACRCAHNQLTAALHLCMNLPGVKSHSLAGFRVGL